MYYAIVGIVVVVVAFIWWRRSSVGRGARQRDERLLPLFEPLADKLIEGEILPKADAVDFNRDAWCRLVQLRPEFRRYPPRQAPNPFKGGMMNLPSHDDIAEVLLGDQVVGNVHWSMSEEPCVNVSVQPSAMPLVLEWAAELGGEFFEFPTWT